MKTALDVPYSDVHDLTRLDAFFPGANGNGRCLFLVHGGGWSGGNRQQWHGVAEHFQQLGYFTASAGYRLAQADRWPAQIEDVRTAFAYVRSRAGEYGFEPNRIAAMGSSAGGHLVAMLATTGASDSLGLRAPSTSMDTRPDAVVCYCPVTTLTDHKLQSGRLTAPYADLIDGTESEHPGTYRNASPLHRVTGDEPPFLFVHGDADSTVPVGQSEAMAQRLGEAGVRTELQVLPGVGHGFGYGTTTEPQRMSLALVEAFLDSVLQTRGG